MMEAFLIATGIVAIAEIGDKTQLLAFILAARYRRPVPIILAITAATLLNHALAGAIGGLLTNWLTPSMLRWGIGIGFIAMAVWALIPDRMEDEVLPRPGLGVFSATFIAFFLAEMGDKTQIATVALAARFDAVVAVVAGTTLGMLIANVPAVLVGDRMAVRLPLRWIRAVAAMSFLALGLLTLTGAGEAFGV